MIEIIAQALGYIASILLAISLMVNNDLKFRWLNTFGVPGLYLLRNFNSCFSGYIDKHLTVVDQHVLSHQDIQGYGEFRPA